MRYDARIVDLACNGAACVRPAPALVHVDITIYTITRRLIRSLPGTLQMFDKNREAANRVAERDCGGGVRCKLDPSLKPDPAFNP